MVRRYDIEGTRSWLYGAIGCLVVALWFGRDGWFPPDSVRETHPDPEDGFYLFNQVVAVVSGLGFLLCLVMHRFAR